MSFKKPFKASPVTPSERYQRKIEDNEVAEQRRRSKIRMVLIAIGLGVGVVLGLDITGLID